MHRMRSNFCQTRGRLDGMRVNPSVQEVHIQLILQEYKKQKQHQKDGPLT